MSVVRLAREVEGFVFNRLQGALLREAYCLVRDGVVGVDDVDRIVREGLGRRWAVIGPFETVRPEHARRDRGARMRAWGRRTSGWAPSAGSTTRGRPSSWPASPPSGARCCRSRSGRSASPGATAC